MRRLTLSSLPIAAACLLVGACTAATPAEYGNGAVDSGTGDGTTDGGADSDAGTSSGMDAGTSGGMDAGTATGMDGGSDAGTTTGTDAGTTGGMDAGTTGTDAGNTGGMDAGHTEGGVTPTAGVIKTVFIILEENSNWDNFNGSAAAPYINNTLLPLASHATNYSNPTGIHPSEPNYLWLEAGTNFGITADGTPSSDHQSTMSHLVTLLNNAGHTWKSYQEDIDGNSCPLDAVMNYAPKHNPMVYFDDVTNTNNAQSAYCKSHVRPFSELATDLANGTVAQYNFITPNLCDDGHNDCGSSPNAFNPYADEVPQTDGWLQTNVPMILNSNAYKNGGALFITWDESEFSLSCLAVSPTCPVGMMVLSPYAKGNNYASMTMYDHSSTLRTMQEIFGVTPLLGGAANATDLSDMFTQFP